MNWGFKEGCVLVLAKPLYRWAFGQWLSWIVVLLACAASFGLGVWFGGRRLEERAFELSHRLFGQFLLNADAIGIIDHGRLDEVIQAKTEEMGL